MKLLANTCCSALLLLAAAAPTCSAATMMIEVGSPTAPPGSTVEVPISIGDAEGLGSLQFDLKFDPSLLEPAETPVRAGADLPGAMIEANASEPGTLRVALISGEPVAGSGEILLVTFAVRQEAAGVTAVTPTAVRAWDHSSNLDMLVESSPGRVTIASKPPLHLWLGAGAAVVVLAVVLVAAGARGRSAKKE